MNGIKLFECIQEVSTFTELLQSINGNTKEVFKYLPDIRKLGITDITEDDFYVLIGLTQQEINEINNC